MKIHNFSAGPGILPSSVLQEIQQNLLNFENSGISILETSHRSSQFKKVIDTCSNDLKSILNIPDDYAVIYMQGGGSSQFSTWLQNFKPKSVVLSRRLTKDYIVTGQWSQKAHAEAQKLSFTSHSLTHDQTTSSEYVYYCDNETVDGLELPVGYAKTIKQTNPNAVIVCDMSSNFLSRRFDITDYGMVFAGAQKNIGPAGVTIVILRKDLVKMNVDVPTMLDYKVFVEKDSLYNTPPTFAIYACGLTLKWIKEKGGVDGMAKINEEKARVLYEGLAKFDQIKFTVEQTELRSRMNVTFRILDKEKKLSPSLESDFVKKAAAKGLVSLGGHRSVGGIRASIYNAMGLDSIHALLSFVKEFME